MRSWLDQLDSAILCGLALGRALLIPMVSHLQNMQIVLDFSAAFDYKFFILIIRDHGLGLEVCQWTRSVNVSK